MDKKLLEAYQEAHYKVLTNPPVRVLTGVAQVVLIDRFPGVTSFCIITAYNPFSKQLDSSENKRSNEKLFNQLQQIADVKICASTVAEDPDNEWPDEPGFLVADLTKDQALKLGRLYQQNAVIWMPAPVYRAEILQCSKP